MDTSDVELTIPPKLIRSQSIQLVTLSAALLALLVIPSSLRFQGFLLIAAYAFVVAIRVAAMTQLKVRLSATGVEISTLGRTVDHDWARVRDVSIAPTKKGARVALSVEDGDWIALDDRLGLGDKRLSHQELLQLVESYRTRAD